MFSKIKAIKNLRDQAKQMQSVMNEVTAEGSAAWGKVKVTLNGNQQVLDVQMEEEVLANRAKAQDAVKEAFNDAMKKLHVQMAGKLKDMGGLDMLKGLGGEDAAE